MMFAFFQSILHTHSIYLRILLFRFQTNQVLNMVPLTPIQQSFSPLSVISSFSNGSLVPLTPPSPLFEVQEVVSLSAAPTGHSNTTCTQNRN